MDTFPRVYYFPGRTVKIMTETKYRESKFKTLQSRGGAKADGRKIPKMLSREDNECRVCRRTESPRGGSLTRWPSGGQRSTRNRGMAAVNGRRASGELNPPGQWEELTFLLRREAEWEALCSPALVPANPDSATHQDKLPMPLPLRPVPSLAPWKFLLGFNTSPCCYGRGLSPGGKTLDRLVMGRGLTVNMSWQPPRI